MGQLLKWVVPDTEFEWTNTRLFRSTDGEDPFVEVTDADVTNYVTATGLPIAQSYAHDRNGLTDYYYKLRFFDSVNNILSEFSEAMQAQDLRGYCTIEDVRNYTNLQAQEYSDEAVQLMIETISESIDKETGRTWKGVQTVADQYLDTDGSEIVQLPRSDIGSITAVAIDTGGTGTYTTVTTTHVHLYSLEGYIILNHRLAAVPNFPDARKSLKISYTWGNADPTAEVRLLALMMFANQIKVDTTRTERINKLLVQLRRNKIASV